MIRQLLASTSFLAKRRKFTTLGLQPSSRVDFWRVRSVGDSCLIVGADAWLASRVTFERAGASLAVGSGTFVGLGSMSIASRVTIGDRVLISWGVTIIDHNSHSMRYSIRKNDGAEWRHGRKNWLDVEIRPVTVGDAAWIGFNASLLPGVSIGKGAIVGAGAVVTRDVPEWTVAAGNPARVLRELTNEERADSEAAVAASIATGGAIG